MSSGGAIMRRLMVTLCAIGMLSVLASGAQTVNAQSGCLTPTTDEAGQVSLSGDGSLNTLPFDLSGGAYTVRWSGSTGSRPIALGNVILYLKRTDGPLGTELLVNTTVSQQIPTASGETHVYNVKPGSFYLAVTSPGEWSVTISPQ